MTIEIRKQLDRIDCELIYSAFDLAIDKPTEYQELKPFTKHKNRSLIALDGAQLSERRARCNQMNVLLCCAGHNLRLALKSLSFLSQFIAMILSVDTLLGGGNSSHHRNQHTTVSTDNLSPLVASAVSEILEVHTYWNRDKLGFTAVEINDC